MKTSAITLGCRDVPAIMLFYLAYLLVWSWVVVPLVQPWAWWLGAVVAAAQVVWHYGLIRQRTRDGCFKAFRLNHWVGAALFGGIFVSSLA